MIDRKMRRSDRELTREETEKVLLEAEWGTLCTVNSDGSPYCVPLNFAYSDGAIYLHGALEGQKVDNIAANPDVCFCAVGDTEPLRDKFTTRYISAIAQGKAVLVTDPEQKKAGLMKLIEKYSPEFLEKGRQYVEHDANITALIKMEVEKLSGKQRK